MNLRMAEEAPALVLKHFRIRFPAGTKRPEADIDGILLSDAPSESMGRFGSALPAVGATDLERLCMAFPLWLSFQELQIRTQRP